MPDHLLLVYVAGPYSAPTPEGIAENCRRARDVGAALARLGVFPVVPHQLGRDIEHIGDYAYWIASTLEVLRRCDAIFLVPGWRSSKGSVGEYEEALRLEIPAFDDELAFALALSQETIPSRRMRP